MTLGSRAIEQSPGCRADKKQPHFVQSRNAGKWRWQLRIRITDCKLQLWAGSFVVKMSLALHLGGSSFLAFGCCLAHERFHQAICKTLGRPLCWRFWLQYLYVTCVAVCLDVVTVGGVLAAKAFILGPVGAWQDPWIWRRCGNCHVDLKSASRNLEGHVTRLLPQLLFLCLMRFPTGPINIVQRMNVNTVQRC